MVFGVLGVGSNIGWAQTKVAVVTLKPYGAMSKAELDENHPIADKPGWMTSGPPGGIAWHGIGEVAIDGEGRVYVGLPIWTTGYAPKVDARTSAARGIGDKLRVLVFNGQGKGELESKMDFLSKSLDRLDLRLAGDGALLVLADDKLMRVGADGKPTAQLDVPNVQKEFEVWYLRSSVSGRIVRLRLNDKSAEFVDAQTLAVIKAESVVYVTSQEQAIEWSRIVRTAMERRGAVNVEELAAAIVWKYRLRTVAGGR